MPLTWPGNRKELLAAIPIAYVLALKRVIYFSDLPRCAQFLGRGFGGCAATHVEGTGTDHAFLAILADRPWVVVTVPAWVLCARW